MLGDGGRGCRCADLAVSEAGLNGTNINHRGGSFDWFHRVRDDARGTPEISRRHGNLKMPFALLIIGAVLLISAVKGTQEDLFALVRGDFTGPQNFIYWMVAILLIGGLGYIPKIKPISVAFLSLVVLVLFLARGDPTKAGGGFFEKFTAGIGSSTNKVTDSTAAAAAASISPGNPATQSVIAAAIQHLQPLSPVVQ
jgi:hypothetical protein